MASTNIQAAVDAAVTSGDIVMMINETYYLSTEIVVSNVITVQSVSGPEVTIVDGQGTCRGFNLGSAACTISGFTATKCNAASGDGGGVICINSTIESNS